MSGATQEVRYIEPNPATGSSLAVVVDNVPLVHTSQLYPRDEQGKPLSSSQDSAVQVQRVLDQLTTTISQGGGRAGRIVKLNIYVTRRETVAVVESVLAQRFTQAARPAVSYVVTRLPQAEDLVAMDGIAVGVPLGTPRIAPQGPENSREWPSAVLPTGSRIFVSGQAEKGADLAEATRRTLESLRKTLQHYGRQDSDIVQLKSFLSPMANVDEARQAMRDFFGDLPLPPTVWVEWQSPLIEIELVAWGGENRTGPAIEFLTPPGMSASPVYSRVTRTNSQQLVYVSGLYSRRTTDAAGEVVDIFDQLGGALRQSASDLRHLLKATYYCSNNETSSKLNELRPKFYDPTRPPAASKALVSDVGRAERGLTVDLIAVPAAN